MSSSGVGGRVPGPTAGRIRLLHSSPMCDDLREERADDKAARELRRAAVKRPVVRCLRWWLGTQAPAAACIGIAALPLFDASPDNRASLWWMLPLGYVSFVVSF